MSHTCHHTNYPPDSLLFLNKDCPQPALVYGTYHLIESESSLQKHKGELVSSFVNADLSLHSSSSLQFESGVFSLKNLSHINTIITANTDGTINFVEYSEDDTSLSLTNTISVEDSMITSIASSDLSGSILACTCSSGNVYVLNHSDSSSFSHLISHEFDAWCSLFFDSNTLLTGGDDAVVRVSDLRSSSQIKLSRLHSAGVVSLSRHPSSNLILSGGYDDQLIMWDIRFPSRKVASCDMPGGVWDVVPVSGDVYGVPCMYGGCSLVEIGGKGIRQLESYNRHKSIVYGFDSTLTLENKRVAATCSFYDKEIRLWEIDVLNLIN
ncbi:hypothetical protein GEMRC1_001977 [Eukaryota sp. GEM-RC1]